MLLTGINDKHYSSKKVSVFSGINSQHSSGSFGNLNGFLVYSHLTNANGFF